MSHYVTFAITPNYNHAPKHRAGLSRMERSATSGLIALAISDMLFCVSVIPNTFVGTAAFRLVVVVVVV